MQFRSLSQEDPLENEMASHSSILAWRIPWTEEPGRLQSMGSQRIRHNRVTAHMTQISLCRLNLSLSLWLKIISQQHSAGLGQTHKKRQQ